MASLGTTVSRAIHGDVTTVTINGTLDLQTAVVLRATLRKCLAECPAVVIIDVSDCACAAPAALAVFGATGRGDPGLPSVPLLLCGASEEFLAGGRASLAGIPTYGNRAEALGAAATVGRTDHWETLPSDRSLAAPGIARAAIRRLCEAWGLSHVRERAGLIVSELVTNGVIHTTGNVRVEAVLRSDFLHIRVYDASLTPPVMAAPADPADEPADHGRGLSMVDRSSNSWGWYPDGERTGKVVWATLRVREIRSDAAEYD